MKTSERFERLAAQFRRETGLTAPGKDRASAEGEQRLEGQELVEEWTRWLAARPRLLSPGGMSTLRRMRR